MSHKPSNIPHGQLPDPEFKDKDISFKGIEVFMIILFLLTTVTIFTMGWMHKVYKQKLYEGPRAEAPPAQLKRIIPTSGPLLQTHPQRDLDHYNKNEAALITRYEWTDQEKGLVRIPVERAMERMIETRAFPVRKP